MIRAVLLLACFPFTAGATDVYRCTGPDGVSYQDKPCAVAKSQSVVHLVDAPPAAPAPPPPTVADDATATATGAAPAPPPPAIPPPSFYLCIAHDGSRYVSDDGVGRRSLVPYAMLEDSGKSLAQAYGPGGIGVSAPELQHPPTVPARADPLGASYVWVVDECHHAEPAEACAYLRGELDTVTGKLRRAFSDTQAQLKQDQAQLRERLRGC